MNKMTLLNAKLAAKMTTKTVLQKVLQDLFPEEVNNANPVPTASRGVPQPSQSLGSEPSGDIYQPPTPE